MTQRYTAEATKDILDATMQAGRELVESNKISAATLERITRPISGGLDSMAKIANAFWKTCIQEGVTPAEFRKKNLVPRPDSIETFLMIMETGFNADRATGVKGILQFNFSGEVEGACSLEIDDGRIEGKEGASSQPDLTVDTPFELWVDIMAGKADGQQMFMEQQYKASGDLSLLLRMKDLFGSTKD
jgi:putative sterol carrier protein